MPKPQRGMPGDTVLTESNGLQLASEFQKKRKELRWIM
jgi:hypothetical protein